MSNTLEKVIFLDRDGVINKKAPPHQHITNWDDIVFLEGVAEAIRIFHFCGFKVIVLTNQSCIARGTATIGQIEHLHDKMLQSLNMQDANIDRVILCPHDNGQCFCRKPEIGMFIEAEKYVCVDKAKSYMLGDSESDIEAGRRYGIKTISIGKKIPGSDLYFESLIESARYIMGEIE